MTELIERYVHTVGLYLPQQERAEIEAELRSLIQDQLDDRYEGSSSQADVVVVLTALGDPRRMAVSYLSQEYLVGPSLYPFMMMILRHGWLIIPSIVVFLSIFGTLVSPTPSILLGWIVDTGIAAIEATLIYSGVVVLIFAIAQRSGIENNMKDMAFNPLSLPKIDDPGVVSRIEVIIGIVIDIVVSLIFLYFLRIGGLTLRFNLNDPGEVIPVPVGWLLLFILNTFIVLILHLWVLRRNRWSVTTWLIETMLEVFGALCLYFVVFLPLSAPLMAAVPALSSIPFTDRGAEILAVLSAVTTLVSRGSKWLKLWNYRHSGLSPVPIKTSA